MPLTKEAIEEFRDIWRREFNEELSFDHAKIEADNLLEFVFQLSKAMNTLRDHQELKVPEVEE